MFTYGVGTSHMPSKNTKVTLASLACVNMASEHRARKVMHGHKIGVIDTALSTFEIISPVVTIRGGVVDGDRVITRIVLGMLF
jgi:hypothetical protein